MNKTITKALLAASFSVLLLLPTACAGTGSASSPPTSGKAQSTVFMDMLRLIPDGNTTQVAYVQDFSRLTQEQRQFPPLPPPGTTPSCRTIAFGTWLTTTLKNGRPIWVSIKKTWRRKPSLTGLCPWTCTR